MLVGAVVLYGLAIPSVLEARLAVILGTVGLALAVARHRSTPPVPIDIFLLMGVLTFGMAGFLGWSPVGIGPTSDLLERGPGLVWLAFALIALLGRNLIETKPARVGLIVLVMGFSAIVGLSHLAAAGGIGLDVLALHVEAADAIASGQNPYSDAVIVDNGAPTARPGDQIVGYVYPPVTALGYAAGEWLFGEPRLVSLLGWLTFLSTLAARAWRLPSRTALLTFLLAASLPGWPLVLRAGWTEPLSLALFGLALFMWSRPRLSGILSGLALGSKQYFAVSAPLVGLYREKGWAQRTMWTVALIVGTVGAGLILGPGEFWFAAVEFHLNTPPRPDGLNLVGLAADLDIQVSLPSVFPILLGLGAALLSARWARTRSEWTTALALTLAVSFLVSSQAFPNYWFLIAGLILLALTHGEMPHTDHAS